MSFDVPQISPALAYFRLVFLSIDLLGCNSIDI